MYVDIKQLLFIYLCYTIHPRLENMETIKVIFVSNTDRKVGVLLLLSVHLVSSKSVTSDFVSVENIEYLNSCKKPSRIPNLTKKIYHNNTSIDWQCKPYQSSGYQVYWDVLGFHWSTQNRTRRSLWTPVQTRDTVLRCSSHVYVFYSLTLLTFSRNVGGWHDSFGDVTKHPWTIYWLTKFNQYKVGVGKKRHIWSLRVCNND